jgi:hypothetical protein
MIENKSLELLIHSIRNVRLNILKYPIQEEEEDDDESDSASEEDDEKKDEEDNENDEKKSTRKVSISSEASSFVNMYQVDEKERREQDCRDAKILSLLPPQSMSRALNWLLTGIDPMKRWTSAVSSSHATTDVDDVVDDDDEIINNEVNESGNGSSSSSTKKLQSLSTASHHLDDDIHNPASDRYGRSLIIENEEKPFVMTDSHDVLIDGVLEDVDYLSGSIEYWKSMIVASGGPVANARADAYSKSQKIN